MRIRTGVFVALALVGLGCFVLTYPANEPESTQQPSAARTGEPASAQRLTDPPAASAERAPEKSPESPAPATGSATSEEEELMVVLRHSWPVDPLGSLEEAQTAEERFPNSPHAPERKWIVVRSLVELKRFQEARDEAARMVARFPNNSWATDAQRHLLVHPLGQPPREEQQPTL